MDITIKYSVTVLQCYSLREKHIKDEKLAILIYIDIYINIDESLDGKRNI